MTSTEREGAAQAFALRSKNGIFDGCVAAMDGWLCKVKAPLTKPGEGAGPRAYFSGHYARMRINVQSCCDARSRFVYVSHPGGVNDIRAYRETGLPEIVETMKDKFYILGDNAYKNTDHLLTPFLGSQLDDDFDHYKGSFNYHLSQLRIRIGTTFGLFVRKWGIFQRPLQNSLKNVTKIIHCAAILHNFVVSERLEDSNDPVNDELRAGAALSRQSFEEMLTYGATDYTNLLPIRNAKRDALVRKLRRATQPRPSRN